MGSLLQSVTTDLQQNIVTINAITIGCSSAANSFHNKDGDLDPGRSIGPMDTMFVVRESRYEGGRS